MVALKADVEISGLITAANTADLAIDTHYLFKNTDIAR